MKERWTPDLLKEHLEEQIEALNHRLDGFPQEYASAAEIDVLRTTLEGIRVDHVQRREVEEIKAEQHRSEEQVRARLDEATGRRSAVFALSGAVAVMLVAALGVVWKDQLTQNDVRQQIQTEAPWLADKAQVEGEIQALQGQQDAIRLQLVQIAALDRFFCRTRQPKLPGC